VFWRNERVHNVLGLLLIVKARLTVSNSNLTVRSLVDSRTSRQTVNCQDGSRLKRQVDETA
jgi:hypothetical protein